jgi:hypothetical protein
MKTWLCDLWSADDVKRLAGKAADLVLDAICSLRVVRKMIEH